ncbi:MAG: hypothetical protein J6C33_09695 [Lachnospiraceae bacterium]|nr:hypothetical protein [Lachnospiraceae bacterium]
MKKSLTAALLACLLLWLSVCAGCTDSSGSAADEKNADTAAVYAENDMEKVQELTIESLLALYENGGLDRKAEKEGLDGFLQYQNLKRKDSRDMDESLTGLYVCSLPYADTDPESGETREKTYEFQLYYWKPETAEEYGYKKNEIDDILLMETETGDAVGLYHSDSRYTTTDDLRGFLKKEYGIGKYLNVSLPEEYTFGGYEADMAYFPGWLFEGAAKEPVHGEWTPVCWYAPGGVGRAENGLDVLQFEDGELTDACLLMNHSEAIAGAEKIENCEVSAVLMEYEFDLFTAAEWEEYLKENPDSGEVETVSRYWYIFMGKEDCPVYYVLFLREDLFSREEAIETARMVRFAEDAF